MKKIMTMAAALGFAALTCAAAALATEKEHPGKAIWDKQCASCHGPDGKGVERMATMLKLDLALLDMTRKETVEKKDEDLRKIIEDGAGKMPGYKKTKKLTDEQIAQVLAYQRHLAEEAKKEKDKK